MMFMDKLKNLFRVSSTYQLIVVFIVFGITGSLSLVISAYISDFFNLDNIILSIITVNNFHEAMSHILKYGSGHTDVIVTENSDVANTFLRNVDSSSVMHNASSRFADGYEYGLGAEIGISTNKLHARGPVGIEGLTNQKFIVIGDGNIR